MLDVQHVWQVDAHADMSCCTATLPAQMHAQMLTMLDGLPCWCRYYRALYSQQIGALLGGGNKNLPNMRNLAMELRKLCCHPVSCAGRCSTVLALDSAQLVFKARIQLCVISYAIATCMHCSVCMKLYPSHSRSSRSKACLTLTDCMVFVLMLLAVPV